jgi:NAD(P)-dependent dehydrogenase (short-subunit alcohol dehydrogenase family)
VTWLITGANRGLGLELARQLTARGDQVIGTVRDPARAEALRGLGARVEVVDVVDPASVAALAARLDGVALDVLINNAGIQLHEGGIASLDLDEVARSIATNALAPMRMVQALLPHLRAGSRRLIAHLSSDLASIGDNTTGGYYGYRASKAALNMLNRTLAEELGREAFTCLVLHPGWVQTDMGGPDAPMLAPDSIRGVLAVLDRATAADSGRFLDHHGADLPW